MLMGVLLARPQIYFGTRPVSMISSNLVSGSAVGYDANSWAPGGLPVVITNIGEGFIVHHTVDISGTQAVAGVIFDSVPLSSTSQIFEVRFRFTDAGGSDPTGIVHLVGIESNVSPDLYTVASGPAARSASATSWSWDQQGSLGGFTNGIDLTGLMSNHVQLAGWTNGGRVSIILQGILVGVNISNRLELSTSEGTNSPSLYIEYL